MQSPGVQGDAMAEMFGLTAWYVVPRIARLTCWCLGSTEAMGVPVDPVPGELYTESRCRDRACLARTGQPVPKAIARRFQREIVETPRWG